MRILLLGVLCLPLASPAQFHSNQKSSSSDWKVVRSEPSNDCIVQPATALTPGYLHILGRYPSKEDALAAMENMRKQDDPNNPDVKVCSN